MRALPCLDTLRSRQPSGLYVAGSILEHNRWGVGASKNNTHLRPRLHARALRRMLGFVVGAVATNGT